MKYCAIENCKNPLHAHGMCSMHVTRWTRHGDPNYRISKHWSNDLHKNLYHNAKYRSKRDGWVFDLNPEDIEIPEFCPVFGMKLQRTGRHWGDSSPSLDRIDSTKGYTRGNVRVVSWLANRLKNNATVEQLELVIKYMKGAV